MKSKTLIIIIISALGIFLLLSTIHDKKINASKIARYRCENNPSIRLPEEYLSDEAKKILYANKRYKINSHQLDWTNLGLTDLPNDIFKNYPCIRFFEASGNEFTKIPTAITDLNDLQVLYLQNNKITSLKNNEIDFKKFRNIGLIDLSSNLIDTLDYIPMTKSFFDLDISSNQIKYVHYINTSKRFVNSLNISHNELSEFPYDFYRLRNLVDLDISYNGISGYLELQGFKELETLNISNQITDSVGITSIVVDGKSCENLTHLKADNNNISSFTFNYTSTDRNTLTQLEDINFRSNKFASFPNLIYDCPRVKILDLGDNKLASIQFEHAMLQLKELDLSNNKIKQIQKLNNIRKIRDLDLSHNQLTDFPFFNDNIYLKTLDLSHNNIENLDYFLINDFIALSNINTLDLSHNQIKIFQKSDKKYVSLRELNLSNNQITTFHCNEYPALKTLDLSNNNLEEIICERASHIFLKIEELNFSNNPNLTDIPTTLYNSSNNLRTINIKNTNLTLDLILFLTQYCRRNNIKLIK